MRLDGVAHVILPVGLEGAKDHGGGHLNLCATTIGVIVCRAHSDPSRFPLIRLYVVQQDGWCGPQLKMTTLARVSTETIFSLRTPEAGVTGIIR